jgi:hypothetical protein
VRFLFLIALAFFAFCARADAHLLPHIPIHAYFDEEGGIKLRTEVDPRCLRSDPNVAGVTNEEFELMSPEQREQWKTQASDYIRKTLRFPVDAAPALEPVFEWTFTTHENAPLRDAHDDVVLTGTARMILPPTATGFSIEATEAGKLNVILRHVVNGKALEQLQVFSPSETSRVLDLKTWQLRAASAKMEAKGQKYAADPAPAPEARGALQSDRSLLWIILSVATLLSVFFLQRARQKLKS